MKSTKSRHPSWEDIQVLALLLATYGLVKYPQDSATAVQEGLNLCAQVIIPALFPFFILSSMVIDLGFSHGLGQGLKGIMSPLFRLNGNCATALVLGFVGGYPVGAKTAVNLYQQGLCSKIEAQRMLAFCNNSGPAFILGVIGAGIFANGQVAMVIYLSHLLACVTVGILFRFYHYDQGPSPTAQHHHQEGKPFLPTFLSAVSKAMDSTYHICGFLLCFTVLIRLLSSTGILSLFAKVSNLILLPFGFPQDYGTGLLIGLLELSSGVTSLSASPNPTHQVVMISFLLGWAGLSVHCQVLRFLQETDLSQGSYFMGNLLQGLFSGGYALLFLHLDPLLPLYQVEALARTGVYSPYLVSLWLSLFLWVLFFISGTLSTKKGRILKRNSV